MEATKKSAILITCFKGLAPYLRQELEALGYAITRELDTGVETEGTLADTVSLNLRLRTALNVFYRILNDRCRNPGELYTRIKHLPWEEIIPEESYFSVTCNVKHPTIDNSMFASLKVKDAIVDRIKEHCGTRPDSGPDRHRLVVHLFWMDETMQLYLNTSGRKLADRGYRKDPGQAPLRETLAAALIMATGYDGSQPLVCPMCGSGTLPIEAALIATGRAPGLLRDNYAFLHLKDFDRKLYNDARRLLTEERKSGKPAPIIATDNDPAAVRAAQKNAMTAGMDHLIEFKTCDFSETPVPEGEGIVLVNPEYGERMGEEKELEENYRGLGDWFKQSCKGYAAYIFTGNMKLAKKVGLRPDRKLEFWNAKIECRLLKYEIYAGSKERDRR